MLPIEDLFTLALGAASLTGEKAQELLETMKVQGHLGENEGKELLNKLLEAAKERKQQVEQMVQDALREQMKKAGLCTKSELAQLRGEVEALRKALERLQQEQAESPESSGEDTAGE